MPQGRGQGQQSHHARIERPDETCQHVVFHLGQHQHQHEADQGLEGMLHGQVRPGQRLRPQAVGGAVDHQHAESARGQRGQEQDKVERGPPVGERAGADADLRCGNSVHKDPGLAADLSRPMR